MPIHERELAELQAEYAAHQAAETQADHGYLYQTDGAHWREFTYTLPRWHYEHAIDEYRQLIDRDTADIIERAVDDLTADGRRLEDDPDNNIPEYLDKRREGRLDPY